MPGTVNGWGRHPERTLYARQCPFAARAHGGGDGRVQRGRGFRVLPWTGCRGDSRRGGVKWAFAIAPVVTLLAVIWLAGDR